MWAYLGSVNVKPYLQTAVGVGIVHLETDGTYIGSVSIDVTNKMFLFEIVAGIVFFVNESVSFDIGMGYVSALLKPNADNPENYKSITSGFAMSFGVVVIL